MSTKEIILTTAIELFNAQGTAHVSTNHIAAAADISPGNLYYHFKNKEHIIRDILEHMYCAWDAYYAVYETNTTLDFRETFRVALQLNFQLYWRYRFFYRELVALLRNDPALAARYREIRNQRFQQNLAVIQELMAVGTIPTPSDPSVIEKALTMSWVLIDFWINHLEINGETISEEQLNRGVDLVMSLYDSYFGAAPAPYPTGVSHDHPEGRTHPA